ncbi:MAG TPA: Hsp70 family protein, partial [Rugosimonospora sp.]|nr:Hsp70 family protein [Rugosimonospora sp.]
GRDAERLSLLTPNRFEPYPKRCVDDGAVLLGDAPVPVVELLAALLRRVVAEAAAEEGTHRDVTLTCPADWGPQRREVLRAAARAAGLGEVRLVEEPTAAAMYCAAVLGQPIPLGRSMLVFDFGGGTLDVTVVRHDPDGLHAVAVGGLDDLGGVDVDAALVGHLGQLVALRQPQVWRRLVDPHSTGELRDRRAFWSEVRAAKEMLSRAPSAPVQVPGSEDALHLTREELERVAGPLIDRAVDEARRVLDRAALPYGTLAGILLVGGSSRIPLAASRLHSRFGVAPTVPEQPELPVAYGGLLVAPQLPGPPTTTGIPARPAWAPQGPPVVPRSAPPDAPTAQLPIVTTPPPGRWAPPVPPTVAPPVPQPQRRRSPIAAIVVSVVVLALVGLLGWGGFLIYQHGLGGPGGNALGGNGGGLTGNGSGGNGAAGSGGKLEPIGSPIDLSSGGALAVTAAASGIFYSVTSGGKTTVHALDPATGKEKWKRDVAIEPAAASLRVVGDLLLVDGTKSASDGGKDMRVVLQVSDGLQLWKADWSERTDVAYLGSDAIVATAGEPYRTMRVNLRTGKQAWASTPIGSIVAYHPVKPELTWATGTTNVPAPVDTFTESLGVNPDRFVQLDADDGTAQVVNGAGKVAVSGKVTVDDDILNDTWTAFDGLLIGAVNDSASAGKGQVTAY